MANQVPLGGRRNIKGRMMCLLYKTESLIQGLLRLSKDRHFITLFPVTGKYKHLAQQAIKLVLPILQQLSGINERVLS